MKKIVITLVVLFFGTNLTFAQAKDSTVVDVFSPNGDGINDVFTINVINMKTVRLKIFDTNSNLIFKSSAHNVKWDGKDLNGSQVKDGVYLYEMKMEGPDLKEYSKKGKINLKR